ncbi:MAG: hypothetical protein IH936_07745 [Acidobacteria bacterium]|nr:hypothetical protein [Acidobacteriota bacterium]
MKKALALDQRLDDWAGQGLWRHLSALVLIALVAAVRWHHCVLLGDALIDEETYLAAFRAMAAGSSPYDIESFHYTPTFAWVGAQLIARVGEFGTLQILRWSSLAGLAVAVWCSSAWLAVSWATRLTLAAAFVAMAPGVGAGLCTGNTSFAVIGVILPALIFWSRRSALAGAVPSGFALGATVAAKPLAPLALVALFFHRPSSTEGRRHQLAGLVGGLTAAALLLPMISRLGEMSAQPIHRLSYARSFSLQRLFALAGFEVNAPAIVFTGAVAVAVLVYLLPLDRSQLLAVAVSISVLATPIVWDHTLLMTLPVQVMALAVAAERWREGSGQALRSRTYELVLVGLGALAIQFSGGVGAVDELFRAAQFAFIALPCFAPALLSAYVLVSTGSPGSTGSAGRGRRKR